VSVLISRHWFFSAALVAVVFSSAAVSQELPKQKAALEKRRRVYFKAYHWMVKEAHKSEVVAEHGSDFLQFFYEIKSTAKEPSLRKMAAKDGVAHGLRFLKYINKKNLEDSSDVTAAIAFLALAREFGLDNNVTALRHKVNAAMKRMTFKSIFDIAKGENCRDPELICDAVISFHFARRAGFQEGKGLDWALKLAREFPYRKGADIKAKGEELEDILIGQDNLATHVIYVLSDYGRLRLKAKNFQAELNYIRASWPRVLQEQDVEGVAEFIDSCRILGVPDKDPMMQKGIAWLLTIQAKDGHFGEGDVYDVYHSTWTVINALRPFQFQGQGPLWEAKKRSTKKRSARGAVKRRSPGE
jgi:hypothetical protein